MNFFFALKLDKFKNFITVPKFTNEGKKLKNISLFSSTIDKGKWLIEKHKCTEDNDFFYLNLLTKKTESIFFLENKNFLKNKDPLYLDQLKPFHDLNTNFTFRANLKIYNKSGEFSSYQSEYPFEMTKKTGSIVTPISSFKNKGQNNFIVFKQIYYLPIKKSFSVFLVNLLNEEVLLKKIFVTNSTNLIDITNIKDIQNCCFYSEGFIGIPIFISYGIKIGISLEHSHPPHLYLLSSDRFNVIANLKTKVKEIVNKKNQKF